MSITRHAVQALCLVVLSLSMVGVPATAASDAVASPGFATPDDAVRAYLGGVVDADAGRILAASAIDEMAEGFRFDRQIDRLKAFQINSAAPAEYPLFVDVNRALHSNRILNQVRNLAYGLLQREPTEDGLIFPVDAAWAQTFTIAVDPARLSGLEIIEIRFPDASLEREPPWLAQAEAQARIFDADELTERVALVSFDGELYTIGLQLLRYGDGWKVSSQSSNLAGTSAGGWAVPTTADAFDRKTSGG